MTDLVGFLLMRGSVEYLLKEKGDQPQVRQFGVKFMKFLGAWLKAEKPSEETEAMARDAAVFFQKAAQSLSEQEQEELDAKAWASVIRGI